MTMVKQAASPKLKILGLHHGVMDGAKINNITIIKESCQFSYRAQHAYTFIVVEIAMMGVCGLWTT